MLYSIGVVMSIGPLSLSWQRRRPVFGGGIGVVALSMYRFMYDGEGDLGNFLHRLLPIRIIL
jgi:hypothetical protein